MENNYLPEKSNKKIHLTTDCGRKFMIDAHEIIHDRVKSHTAQDDKDSTYAKEYSSFEKDDFEIANWLFGNMDWFKCKTLVELPTPKRKLSELEVKNYSVT